MDDGTTHYNGCWESGVRHYNCALIHINELEFKLDKATKEIQRLRLELTKARGGAGEDKEA